MWILSCRSRNSSSRGIIISCMLPLENLKAIGLFRDTGLDPLGNYKATTP